MMLRQFLCSINPFYISLSNLNSANILKLSFIRLISCWKCGASHVGVMTCSKCQATQDHLRINYFELFKLKPNFDVDTTEIISAYHKLQKQFHPDKHTNEPEEAQKMSVTFSTLINKAYKTLINPLDRGIYILKLNNNSTSLTSVDDPDLLTEVLDLSDEIASIATKRKLLKIRENINTKLKDKYINLSEAFKNEDFEIARKLIVELKYYENLKMKVNAKEAILTS